MYIYLTNAFESSDATKYSRQRNMTVSSPASWLLAVANEERLELLWQRVNPAAHQCATSLTVYIRCTLPRERRDARGASLVPWRATVPGAKAREVETPLCASRVRRTVRFSCVPRPPHEYLNWILKAQNHRTNEPSPREDSPRRAGQETPRISRREMIDPQCSWITRGSPWKSKEVEILSRQRPRKNVRFERKKKFDKRKKG